MLSMSRCGCHSGENNKEVFARTFKVAVAMRCEVAHILLNRKIMPTKTFRSHDN